jgi:CRP/FNR family transcriptional regulator
VNSPITGSPYLVWDAKGFEKEVGYLLAVSTTRAYREGEFIYFQGETGDAFFFIRKGKVKVSILKGDGSEKIIGIQESNTFFGEYAAFDRHPHFATAVALEPSEISRVPIDGARRMIEAHPEVAFLIIDRIVRKFRSLCFQVEGNFLDAQRRIARILISLGDEVGERETDGVTIRKGITHEDLANLTGLSRVRVTTILNNLQRADIITKRRGMVTITNPAKLRNIIEGIE